MRVNHKNKILFGVSQVAIVVKNTPADAGYIRDVSSITGSGRSPEEWHGNPSNNHSWKISWIEEPGRLQSIGS